MDYDKVFRIERYDKSQAYPEPGQAGLAWRDGPAPPARLAGFAWFAQDRIYRRLPLKPAHELSADVDGLAWHTAGGQLAFRTDSTRLAVRVKLAAPPGAWNMAPTGQCGFDCYLGEPGALRYANTTRLEMGSDSYGSWLYEELTCEMRAVTLNFPLYMGVECVELGLDPDARVEAPPPWALSRPVVVYGTSITQGASASRPGMAYTNILSRRLNLEFINLGFSGSALCEPGLARLIADMPLPNGPACLVLDCDSNMRGTAMLKERFPAFAERLRERHPRAPILAVSKPPFMTETHHPEVAAYRLERRDFLKEMADKFRSSGDANFHFLDGTTLYGADWDECSIDQRHATDLGFHRMAAAFEPVLRNVLFSPSAKP